MTLIDISEISRLLAAQIDNLVPTLLPSAVREGPEWRIGSIAGDVGRSMAIHSGGARAGVWRDFSGDDQSGDALDLVAAVLFAGDKKQAVAWSKSWLGIDNLSPDRLKTIKAKAQKAEKKAKDDQLQEVERKRKYAHALWLESNPRLANTPVDLYLRGRGIFISELQSPLNAVRFAGALDYPAAFNDGIKTKWPAMVSAVINGDGAHIATHRTYLQMQADGRVTKAPVKDAKLTVGSYRGGFIPLTRGASNKSLRHAPADDQIIICEGIEDGLSIGMVCPDYRILAAISVGNFQSIMLPPQCENIIIAADNDAPDTAAGKALQTAIDRFLDEGRTVSIIRSPVGKDFNDALMSGAPMMPNRGLA